MSKDHRHIGNLALSHFYMYIFQSSVVDITWVIDILRYILQWSSAALREYRHISHSVVFRWILLLVYFVFQHDDYVTVTRGLICRLTNIGISIIKIRYSHDRLILIMEISILTQWGRATHICISKLTIIGSGNDLSPSRLQTIIWTNAGILLIGTLGTNFREILSEIHTFSLKKIRFKTSSAKWRPFCLGLNVLRRGPG